MRTYQNQRSASNFPEKLAWGICLIFLAVGLLMLVLAVVLGVRKAEKLKSWVRVDAEIIAHSGGGDGPSYTIVQYEANDGLRTAVLNSYSSLNTVGGTTPVFYDPNKPSEVTEGGLMAWIASAILGFLGLGFTGFSGFLLFRSGILPALRARRARPEKQKDRPAPWEY